MLTDRGGRIVAGKFGGVCCRVCNMTLFATQVCRSPDTVFAIIRACPPSWLLRRCGELGAEAKDRRGPSGTWLRRKRRSLGNAGAHSLDALSCLSYAPDSLATQFADGQMGVETGRQACGRY